jgi:lipid kinase YegS
LTSAPTGRGHAAPAHRSLRLVLHGKYASDAGVRSAVGALRKEGHAIDVRVTWEEGDAIRLAREAADSGAGTVAAGGGDGTVNEVVSGLLGPGRSADRVPALGVLPLGTANDFARACGIPLEPLPALRLIAVRTPVPIDVGRAGDRLFLNVATGGFGTEITTETPEEIKSILGGAAYLLTGLTRFTGIRGVPGRFRAPGFRWEGSFLVLAVGNGRLAGGGYVLCPNALLDDGLLDVAILPDVPEGEIGKALRAVLGQGLPALGDAVVQARVPWLELESPSALHLSLDGEAVAGTSFRFEVQAGALRLHLPERSPVLRETAGKPEEWKASNRAP